ncbi:hypothetical protein, partial [Bradyrhizobium canariense]|uniref:hypothetical protein n=1 Tax=Bradyrhizobium canariense TaxID=255045 RepID=UPI000A266437
TASTSNLGGTIETFSSDPRSQHRLSLEQTLGSYSATRSFVRYDTGDFGEGNSAYVSAMRLRPRAWDFDGSQGGEHYNAKFVRRTGDDRPNAPPVSYTKPPPPPNRRNILYQLLPLKKKTQPFTTPPHPPPHINHTTRILLKTQKTKTNKTQQLNTK